MNVLSRVISLGMVFGFASVISAPAQTATLSPTSLTYDNLPVDTTSSPKTVTLENTGAATLDISNITASAYFAISTNTCGATLDAGKKCKVSVTFTPTQLGTISGTLSFSDNAPDSPQAVSLSGTAIPQVATTPTSLAFSTPLGFTSLPENVKLKNNLSTTLTGISYSTTGPFAIFDTRTTCLTTLAPHTACTIRVTFSASQTGTATGTLLVSDSDGTQTVSLSGTSTGSVLLTPSSMTFPATAVGDTSDSKTAELYPQVGDLTNISYSTMAPFAVASSDCPTTLDQRKQCRIYVTFAPTQAGTATGTLIVNDSDGTQTISLSGTGTNAAVYASPAAFDFGDEPVDSTSNPTRISLFNEGSQQITVSSVSITGNFSITTNYCTDGLKPDSHCDVDVVFSPTESGALSGTLTFVDNATGSPQTVSLSGTGD
jgi:hypothetical protein